SSEGNAPPPPQPQPPAAPAKPAPEEAAQDARLRALEDQVKALSEQLAAERASKAAPPAPTPAPAAPPPAPPPAPPAGESLLDALRGIVITSYVQAQYESHDDSEDQLRQGGVLHNQNRFLIRRGRLKLEREWEWSSVMLEVDGNTTKGPA